MHPSRDRVALRPHYHRDDLAAVLASLPSLTAEKLETLGLGILVCAFWAVVMYAAVIYGLR